MSRPIPDPRAALAALALLVAACAGEATEHRIDLCLRSDGEGIAAAVAGGGYRLTLRDGAGAVVDQVDLDAAGGDPIELDDAGDGALLEVVALDPDGQEVARGAGAFDAGAPTCVCVARDATHPLVCQDVVCRFEEGTCRYFEASGDPVAARTVRFGDDEADLVHGVTHDTEIRSTPAADNFGAHATIAAGLPYDLVGLLRFDLAGLPPEAVIEEATIALSVVDDARDEATDLAFHEVTEAWEEGSEDGAEGCASWACRLDGTGWSVEGCGFQSQSVKSREDDPAITEVVPPDAEEVAFDATSLARAWAERPEENFGLAVLGTPALRLHASEGVDGRRPALEIRFHLDE